MQPQPHPAGPGQNVTGKAGIHVVLDGQEDEKFERF